MSIQQYQTNIKIARETVEFLARKEGDIVCIIGLGHETITPTSFVFANPEFTNEEIINLMEQLLARLKQETSQIIQGS